MGRTTPWFWGRGFLVECNYLQVGDVGGVDVALQRLQVVALLKILDDSPLVRLDQAPLHVRQLGRQVFTRAEVGPDHAAPLPRGVRLELDFAAEVRVVGLAGQVDAVAMHVELPPVIDTAQAALLVSAVEERGATMGTECFDEADLTVGVPKRDQVLAHDLDADRWTVGFGNFVGQQHGQPVATEQFAHGCAAVGPGDKSVVQGAEHAYQFTSIFE